MVTNSSKRSTQKKVRFLRNQGSETQFSTFSKGDKEESTKQPKTQDQKNSLDFLEKSSNRCNSTDLLMSSKLLKTAINGEISVKNVKFPTEMNVRVMDKLKLKHTGAHNKAICSRMRLSTTSTLSYNHTGLNYSYNYLMKHGDPFVKKIEE